jgi:soluble lytic murein transglycosylase
MTATISTTAAVSTTASITPAAAPASVAIPVADPALIEGRRLQRIGDCDGARRTLAAFLADDPTGEPAAEARYLLAQCYLRDDAPGEAATALSQLLAEASADSPWRGPAQFLLGEAQSRLGLWREAEANYAAYLPAAPEVASLVWQRIGAARREAGDAPGAEEAYNNAVKSSPDWTNTVASRRGLAGLAEARGDAASAVAQYDILRGDNSTGAWAAEMQWRAGDALAAAGDMTAAQERWQAAVDADPTSGYAHRALVELVDSGAPVDELQRGITNYHNDVYELAIAAFERVREQDPSGRAGAAWYFTGLSQLGLGETGKGLAELGNFIAAYPGSPYWNDAWMAKARAQSRAGDDEAAIATYREFAGQRPDAPQAIRALMQAAYLEGDLGRAGPAADAYLEIARRYPSSDDAWRAYQAAALIHYKLGDYRKAGEIWNEMASAAALPSFTRPVAYFWLGRAQHAAGEKEAAGRSWQQAVATGPESFYGLRAADWLVQTTGGAQTPPRIPPPATPDQERAELETWLRGWAGDGSLELPESVLGDPDWQRGKTLLALGLRAEALANWGRVQKRAEKDPWALTTLALAFRDAGAYRLSLLSAEQAAALWGKGGMRDAPVALQRLAYPYPYTELVRKEAERWGLDPRLLLAVIRQESRFEAAATSSAGARGLMQVMPGTAQGIADRLGWQDFDPAQAYLPYINVALGANYVAEWLKHFNGSLATALAAYNGGPGNAAIWRKWADDDDLMTALININETRVYVQAVQVQYEMYRRLYER